MKNIIFIIVITSSITTANCQTQRSYNEDSLKVILEGTSEDTSRVNILLKLAQSYFFKQPDSCFLYSQQAYLLSKRLNYIKGVQESQYRLGESLRLMGRYTDALKQEFDELEFNKKLGDEHYVANALGFIGICYYQMNDFEQALTFLKQAVAKRKNVFRETGARSPTETLFTIYIGNSLRETGHLDSAFYFLYEAKRLLKDIHGIITTNPQLRMLWMMSYGDALYRSGNTDSANFYYKHALRFGKQYPDMIPMHTSLTMTKVARLFNLQNNRDSSFYFARSALRIAKDTKLNLQTLESTRLLAQIHRKYGDLDSAFFYLDIATAMNDSIYGPDKLKEQQLLLLQEQRRNQEIQQTEERRRNNSLLFGSVSITTIVLVASILLFSSNKIKQRTNHALQKTLTELKSTQTQLIQSEKMASLGELTAGIAHEIQNPLNFVNNFSELNKELIDELNQNAREGKIDAIQKLASDIKENEEKIEHHGKRADAIVKSMLQHSRISSGKKELTDINTLCDEYLRLAYHGFKAKDKSFSATFEKHLDPSLTQVTVVTQDIGRVILNLINNAFYAVNEKSKTGSSGYTPIVKIMTKNLGDKVEIRIEDNGMGIPESIKEKIFQPFFSTKPTGQGTGLGLSLSYDIVKAHGGTLDVNSKEGERSEFIILLPSKTE